MYVVLFRTYAEALLLRGGEWKGGEECDMKNPGVKTRTDERTLYEIGAEQR